MLANAKCSVDGEDADSKPDFKEASVGDFVIYIIGPIPSDFKRKTGCKKRLRREKEIISADTETGGVDEFVLVNGVTPVLKERFVIEGKRSSVGQETQQCLLAMNDARDNNHYGVVYRSVTIGVTWQTVRYDGTSFQFQKSCKYYFIQRARIKRAKRDG
ncbi:hypothetical protein BDZ91DRAFT_722678 [Kalaharituber pfeilii]|nr:hypothetical protein BDZ91DRAFT_722678 [Kalaharituber pfeilii]